MAILFLFQAQKWAGPFWRVPRYETCQRDAGQGQRLLLETLPRYLQDLQHQLHRYFWSDFLLLILFSGLLVMPNVSSSASEKIICKKDSDFALFRWEIIYVFEVRVISSVSCSTNCNGQLNQLNIDTGDTSRAASTSANGARNTWPRRSLSTMRRLSLLWRGWTGFTFSSRPRNKTLSPALKMKEGKER